MIISIHNKYFFLLFLIILNNYLTYIIVDKNVNKDKQNE